MLELEILNIYKKLGCNYNLYLVLYKQDVGD